MGWYLCATHTTYTTFVWILPSRSFILAGSFVIYTYSTCYICILWRSSSYSELDTRPMGYIFQFRKGFFSTPLQQQSAQAENLSIIYHPLSVFPGCERVRAHVSTKIARDSSSANIAITIYHNKLQYYYCVVENIYRWTMYRLTEHDVFYKTVIIIILLLYNYDIAP